MSVSTRIKNFKYNSDCFLNNSFLYDEYILVCWLAFLTRHLWLEFEKQDHRFFFDITKRETKDNS